MDPDAALANLVHANNACDAFDACDALQQWLERGGFMPREAPDASECGYFASDFRSVADHAAHLVYLGAVCGLVSVRSANPDMIRGRLLSELTAMHGNLRRQPDVQDYVGD